MDSASKNVEPPEPSRELISSERVRFLTSWKLWVPMLFLALLLIAASILWPAYRRMKALQFIEANHGRYELGDARWPWLASQMGPMEMGYRHVESFLLQHPISLADFQLLKSLSDAEVIIVSTNHVTPEWIDAMRGFPQLKSLYLDGTITTGGIIQLIDAVPTVEELFIGHVESGDLLSGDLLRNGDALKSISITDCHPSLTIENFRELVSIRIEDLTDAELILNNLPNLKSVLIANANEHTRLTLDAPLERFIYGKLWASNFTILPEVEYMVISQIASCTITGGEQLSRLEILQGDDVTIENLPLLSRLECTSSIGGTLTLRNLPQLEHFILMSVEGYSRPNVVLDGVDNLRAIDAPWWRPNWTTGDPALLQICELPRLEHLVIPRATLTPEYLPLLQQMETLRFLRLPRQLLSVSAEGRNEWQETDFDQLRRDFPQPGIRIHGPPRSSEQDDRWTPSP